MPTPEEIRAKLEALKKQQEALEQELIELSKPITAEVTNVIFGGLGGIVEIKVSRFDEGVVNRLRYIPSRNYIHARQVNQFKIEDYDRLVYELKECNIDLSISEEFLGKINEYKDAPDFKISYNEEKHRVEINKTIRQKQLPYVYDIAGWTNHSTNGFWSFPTNELLKWMELQVSPSFKIYKFELSDKVQELFNQQYEREKLLDQFADMKDADIGGFKFKWNGCEYELKPDQRVACKFDDTFNHRTLLSFDMGKGKTAIAIAQAERHNERVLFICKADLKTNIKREVKKFTGKEAIVFAGVEPDGLAIDLMIKTRHQYNILNYDVVGRNIKDEETGHELMKWVELINIAGFDRIIYDEAHYMKNMEAQRSKGGRALKAPKVMLLTGTPIVNRPGEIFPLLNIIDPTTFYDYSTFMRQFTDSSGMPKNLPQLHKLLKRYMIRRLADTQYKPDPISQFTELSPRARQRYAEVYDGLYRALRSNDDKVSNVNNIMTQLLRLKQICADDKVDYTVDLVETALDETVEMPWNKVLVFSQFKATQAEIALRLGNKAAIINGDVTDKARYKLIDRFQDRNDSLKVIVTNIVEGITLTQAFTTIHNDLWWTPKDHVQAMGRAFGRENDPHGGNPYFVLAENSIDDMIWQILEKKMIIAKQIVDDVYSHREMEESLFSELIRMIKGK